MDRTCNRRIVWTRPHDSYAFICEKTSEENKRRKTLENEAKIRELLLNNKEMKTSELAEAIGLSEQRTRVILQGMKDVKAVGNTTSRRYRLE